MRRIARTPIAVAVFLVALGLSSAAAAQISTGELTDSRAESRVAGELGFFYRKTSATSDTGGVQPSFYLTLKLAELGVNGFLDLDFAWRAVGVFGSASAFRAYNPYVGVRLGARGGDVEQSWRVRGGGGLTAPLTNLYDDYSSLGGTLGPGLTTFLVLAGMQGFYDGWLDAPLSMAVVARGDVELRGRAYTVGADTAFAALIPVTYRGRTGNTELLLQIGGWAAWRALPQLALGVRVQAVAAVSTASGPGSKAEGYTSLIPFVRGEFGDGFVEGRLVINLDDPFGFAFDGATGTFHVWAIYLLGGSAF